jgi:hypothetical protein
MVDIVTNVRVRILYDPAKWLQDCVCRKNKHFWWLTMKVMDLADGLVEVLDYWITGLLYTALLSGRGSQQASRRCAT